ncbi:MAG: nitrogenase component 1 [Treponema sp.]|jgi:nitrogenase molybdenum-iron protein alpha/beta subunit|nr:nitrogenase component 1 [Treponema sp.]
MSQLLYHLPPLSPDYSGVASVFHDLGALTIIHDAAGCTGTYTGYDEPRWFGSSSPTFSSGLRDMDAIMGDDEKLLGKITRALEYTGAPCVSIIGSPVPMVIGFDFKGFASLVERRTGLPAFGFPATGLEYYDQGQEDAYLAIAKRLLNERPARFERGVNILGASALDDLDKASLDVLESLLGQAGLERLAVWGARSPRKEIEESGGAAANWVITAAAIPLARYLKERFGTPFVTGLPVGAGEWERIRSGLCAAAEGRAPKRIFPPVAEEPGEKKLLIAGEALFASSLRAYLETECGTGPVRIASFFTRGTELFRSGDQLFITEDDARRAFSDRNLERVITDPLMGDLFPGEQAPRLIPLPHRAVSGRLYNESRSRFFNASPFPAGL